MLEIRHLRTFTLLAVEAILTYRLTMIDVGVLAGPHYVECSLMGKEGETTAPFKMLGM